MSANPDVLRASELVASAMGAKAHSQGKIVRETKSWDPQAFAREQIRTLVRRVFFNCEMPAARQVVFSASGANPGVVSICHQVGEALAMETSASVVIVIREQRERSEISFPRNDGIASVRGDAVRLAGNLWRVAEFGPCGDEQSGVGRYWVSRLAELRSKFEFAVIHGPAAEASSEAALLGELTDGIVLVLGAGSTRRASARKVKECLQAGSSRILGTVLSERVFPIPERIYRRL
jgi:hypothetical protein